MNTKTSTATLLLLVGAVMFSTAQTTTPKPPTEAKETLKKIETVKTIKEFFIDNLRKAADKVDEKYNGTIGQRDELSDLLRDQADYSQENNGFAFFDNKANTVFEKGLSEKGLEVAKKVAIAKIERLLPQIHNFPTDAKVASEFTTIVKDSLNGAINTRAQQLGLVSEKVIVPSN